MIQYNSITYSTTMPTNPQNYDLWITKTGSEYQVYIYADSVWLPFTGGGTFSDGNDDVHYFNNIVSNTEPAGTIKFGWFWTSEAVREVKLYIGEYITLGGW